MNNIFPAVRRGGSSYLSFHYHRIFILVLTSLFHVHTSFLSQCNLLKIESQGLCSKFNMAPVKVPQMINQFMFMLAGIHNTPLSSLKQAKISTSRFDVTVTLKRQRKIVNIFFLKQNRFFYKKIMFDTFTKKYTRNYTAAYTKK